VYSCNYWFADAVYCEGASRDTIGVILRSDRLAAATGDLTPSSARRDRSFVVTLARYVCERAAETG
jgi:hypothetical protein